MKIAGERILRNYKSFLSGLVLTGTLLTLTQCNEIEDAPAENLNFVLKIKEAGNPVEVHRLTIEEKSGKYYLLGSKELPVDIELKSKNKTDNETNLEFILSAKQDVNFNFEGQLDIDGTSYEEAYFYLPGFWYRKNLRSSNGAPSARDSKAWSVREDRLSAPLTGIYDTSTGISYTVARKDLQQDDALIAYKKGDVIVHDKIDLGFVGFNGKNDRMQLLFGYPFTEAPYTYIRKLTLAPPVTAFAKLEKGQKKFLYWQIRKSKDDDYSEFMKNTWNYSFDLYSPEEMNEVRTDQEIKEILSQYFIQSFTDDYPLKGFSGVHLHIDKCEQRGIMEIGFVGRVLLNAYNAVEQGYINEDIDLLKLGHNVFNSYEKNGFIEEGFLREVVDFRDNNETQIYSIRRQSEGLYAIIQYLALEKSHGRAHINLEKAAMGLLDRIVDLQQDGYFPRKFKAHGEILDEAGGSSSTAVIPLLMGYKYFNKSEYFESAKQAARYIEAEIIEKGDYFSSTLDANCEDKEASIYASSAMYYLGLTTKGEEQVHYYKLAEKAAYFALSWYYLWDVPFAEGQMLGDLGFKTRGWGNVSVENNHVDVYIFDFADVLKHLASIHGNERLSEMAAVIKSSMREQLLPVEGRLCGIAKVGYYPEVVQHTNWDYGQFGKGYYNDIFAPGWTVTSLWELLSEDRLHKYFSEI